MTDRFTKLPGSLTRSGVLGEIGGSACLVLIVLMDHADGDGHCFPSVATIRKLTCLGQRTISKSIERLENLGLVNVQRTNGSHHRYTLTLNQRRICGGPESQPAQNLRGTSAESAPEPAQNLRPKKNQEEEPIKKSARPPSRKPANGYHEPFLSFYDTYPRKVAKPKALEAYDKAVARVTADKGITSDEAHDLLRDAATAYAASVDDVKYAAYPATWLNGDRWDDELPSDENTDPACSEIRKLMAELSPPATNSCEVNR